jgi:peptidoglycan/xylan/chitin deacetylase (PgdA/CDA1 family)
MSTSISPSRWVAKKAARRGLAAAAFASGSLAARALVSRVARVLTYHRFGEIPRDPFCVPARVFESQMRWLADSGRAVSLADLRDFLAGSRAIPNGSVLVTIDDGCRSLHRIALPILQRWRIPAVAFVTTGLIGAAEGEGEAPEPYLDWSELAELCAAGVEIGSHSHSHRSFGRISAAEMQEEAQRSRDGLSQRLGRAIASFAYPFGTRADFGPAAEEILGRAGYELVFHSMHGSIRAGMDPLRLPRIKVEGGEGLWMFRRACDGALDAWRAVDWALWRLQQRAQLAAGDAREQRADAAAAERSSP